MNQLVSPSMENQWSIITIWQLEIEKVMHPIITKTNIVDVSLNNKTTSTQDHTHSWRFNISLAETPSAAVDPSRISPSCYNLVECKMLILWISISFNNVLHKNYKGEDKPLPNKDFGGHEPHFLLFPVPCHVLISYPKPLKLSMVYPEVKYLSQKQQ